MFRKYKKRVAKIPPMSREKRIDLICHLYVTEKKTMEAIGVIVGLTRERVRQIIKKSGIESRGSKGWRLPRVEFNCANEGCTHTVARTQRSRYPKYCSVACANKHYDRRRKVSPYSKNDPRYNAWRKEYAIKKARHHYHNVFKKKKNWREIVRERNARYAQIRKINSIDVVL